MSNPDDTMFGLVLMLSEVSIHYMETTMEWFSMTGFKSTMEHTIDGETEGRQAPRLQV